MKKNLFVSLREPEVVVISDFHLGTYGCKAELILKYLKSIRPKTLVLNGDIVDAWRFSRSYFPKSHFKVVRRIIKMMEKGTEVVYITGNHDDFLRSFGEISLGRLKVCDHLILRHEDRQTLIFHGDLIDDLIQRKPRLAKVGALMYGFINFLDRSISLLLNKRREEGLGLYRRLTRLWSKKDGGVSEFETKLLRLAKQARVDTIICGHTHVPRCLKLDDDSSEVYYLNCGDWVENFTAVEYTNGQWELVEMAIAGAPADPAEESTDGDTQEYFRIFLEGMDKVS